MRAADLSLVYLCEPTWEGFLTAVFEAYARRPAPAHIACVGNCQQQLGMTYETIAPDEAKAKRVESGIVRHLGFLGYEKAWQTYLSKSENKEDIIYKYIQFGIEKGKKVHQYLADERVAAVEKQVRLVGREASLLREFARFSQLDGGIYYGEITPEHEVLALLMPHFADRFRVQPFILHDKTHHMAGVFDTKEWWLTSTADMQLPSVSEEEYAFRRLWKTFYDTIAIRERINPALQRNNMPKKYWKNMTEMKAPSAAYYGEDKKKSVSGSAAPAQSVLRMDEKSKRKN